ncbi:MAG: VOC family protein [Actinobacteria bacterium]|nr:VOC family protein [Actinomycetota bacterium]
MRPRTLDHIALWVADRDRIAELATGALGMHVIERTERFTLLGADARRGKLTLFEAEGPRERGALRRIGLRVTSTEGREPVLDLGEGLEVVLVEGETDVEFDLDHVALLAADPAAAASAWEAYGLVRAGETRLEVGGAYLELHEGSPGAPARPLLNHIGVLVDSVDEHLEEAEELGIEVDDVVDAANTRALFVWGPDRVKLEYVEHKPSFSLS